MLYSPVEEATHSHCCLSGNCHGLSSRERSMVIFRLPQKTTMTKKMQNEFTLVLKNQCIEVPGLTVTLPRVWTSIPCTVSPILASATTNTSSTTCTSWASPGVASSSTPAAASLRAVTVTGASPVATFHPLVATTAKAVLAVFALH